MSLLCGYNARVRHQCVDNRQNTGMHVDKVPNKGNVLHKGIDVDDSDRILRYVYIVPVLICIIFLSIMPMTGCSENTSGEHTNVDYTVVENEDLPTELKKLIDSKKANTLRMTYTTKDYTYVVAGFGTKETSGYSIKVNDVYKSGDAIYADFTLMGPAENEAVNENATTPYIVLKYEKRDESVVFRM